MAAAPTCPRNFLVCPSYASPSALHAQQLLCLLQQLPYASSQLWTSQLRVLSGAEETKLTRENLKWPYGEFEIPQEVYETFSNAGKKGKAAEDEWKKVRSAKSNSVA